MGWDLNIEGAIGGLLGDVGDVSRTHGFGRIRAGLLLANEPS